jgi:dienelactone hydrolase
VRGGRGPAARPGRGVAGLVLLILGAVLLGLAGSGTTTLPTLQDGTPVEVVLPEVVPSDGVPGVVVVHGFAGSARLMRTWSLALARAGFAVAAPDLAGQGRSTSSLGDVADLAADVEHAVAALIAQPGVDPGRIGVLGHSLGTGAALAAIDLGLDARGVVLVSPTDGPVDAGSPPDLLLMAGALEPRFVANARDLLDRAGGAGGLPGDGDARAISVIPRVEHVTILFAPEAHRTSIAWLAAALDHVPVEGRAWSPVVGWLLLVVGLVLGWQAVVGRLATPAADARRRRGSAVALAAGALAATASLVVLQRSVDLPALTGMLVGGEVGVWFVLAGALWLRFGDRPAPPAGRDVGWAVLTAGVGVAIGAAAASAWLPWWPVGTRVPLVPLLVLACLPVTVGAATAMQGRRGAAALGTWLQVAGVLTIGLGLAAVVVPGVGFLILLLPLVPAVVGLLLALAAPLGRPWASGAGGAVLLGWLLAVLFPLA